MNWLKALLSWVMGLPERFMRFWFPYLFYFDDDNPEPMERESWSERRRRKKRERQKEKAKKSSQSDKKSKDEPLQKPKDTSLADEPDKSEKPIDVFEFGKDELGVKIMDVSEPFDEDDAFETISKSASNLAYFYHDDNYHQIAVKFKKGSRKAHYQKRDDVARKQLKPLLYPNANQPFDRTHIIPIGYHGSENDNRLLVGFNSKLNRKDLRDFEIEVSKFNDKMTVLWFVSIDKQPDTSAIWYATVWDEKGKILLEDSFHDRDPFTWK